MVDTPPEKNPDAEKSPKESLEEIKDHPGKRKYVQVGYDKRKELLQVLDEGNLTIKSAAEKLNINYSNAKNIVKLYKTEYRIEKLPKKPNLTLKEITSPPFVRDGIPFRSALLPFYDPAEAQQFIHWNENKHSGPADSGSQNDAPNSRQATGATTNPHIKESEEPEQECLNFNFEVYKSSIEDRRLSREEGKGNEADANYRNSGRTLPSPFPKKDEE